MTAQADCMPTETRADLKTRVEFESLLKQVSRSFFLTIRVLPQKIRRQIGLAYLLARATDTVADTEALPVERRLEALAALRDRILGISNAKLAFSDFISATSAPATVADPRAPSAGERTLLLRIEDFLSCLDELSTDDLQLVRTVLSTITSGQELDLRRFGKANVDRIVALQNMEELDDYTFRVAGCVGEFWTRICRAHLFPDAKLDEQKLLTDAVRFGKGLQLINVLRDVPVDLRGGRCYLPEDRLKELSLSPGELLEPGKYERLAPLYCDLLGQAEAHLEAGWQYTNMLPRNCRRVRLACAWPILIGVQTARKLRDTNILNPKERVKISRPDVRRIIMRSIVGQFWPPLWHRLFRWAKLV